MAAAKVLAQMALRDAAGGTGTQPEPELTAWNLHEAGAQELISHLQPNRENDLRPTAANHGNERDAELVFRQTAAIYIVGDSYTPDACLQR